MKQESILSSHLTIHIQKAKQIQGKRGSQRTINVIENPVYAPIPNPDIQQQAQQPKCDLYMQFGLECSNTVKDCKELVHNLLETGAFVPEYGMSKDQKIEHKTLFTNIDSLENNRNAGSIVGMTTLGFIGFVGSGFNVFGAIGGVCAGIFMGRYAGQKISKKFIKKKGKLREFDIFTLRLRCVIQWVQIKYILKSETQMIKYKLNFNVWRFSLERLMLELKPLLHYLYFDKSMQQKSRQILKSARKFLIQSECQNAIYLTYKLSKAYLDILEKNKIYSNFGKADFEFILVFTIQNVLRPFESLFTNDPNMLMKKNPNLILLSNKIKKLYTNPTVINLMNINQDTQLTIEYIKAFSIQMKLIVKIEDIEKFLQCQNYEDVQSLGMQQVYVDSPRESQARNLKDEFFQSKQVPDIVRTNKKAHSQLIFQSPLIPTEMQEQKQDMSNKNKNSPNSSQKEHSSLREKSSLRRSASLCLRPKKPRNNQNQQLQGDNENCERESALIMNCFEDLSDNKIIIKFDEPPIKELKILEDLPISIVPTTLIQVVQNEQNILTPVLQHARLSDELETKFQLMIDIINEPTSSWDIVLQKENILIHKTYKFGNNAVFIKGYGDIPGVDKESVFQCIYDAKLRTQWDKLLENFHIVEKETDEVDTVYYYVSSPFGAANRDFLQKRICRMKYPREDQNCLLYFSTENKKAPKPKGYVRCQTFLSGYIIENLPNNLGARLYFVSNNDVGGNIPKSLVNFVATRAPVSWFNSLRKGCTEIYKKQQQALKVKVQR